MSTDDTKEKIHFILKEHGAQAFEVISLARPLTFDFFKSWLDKGYHADMQYLKKNENPIESPHSQFPSMKSVIVFTESYFPSPKHQEPLFKNLKVAHYARNKDYHFWFQDKLKSLIEKLQAEFPEESFQAFTDAVPLLERDLGAQAALGWVGKNTCLIHPKKGSLFFIGEILTSLSLTNTPEKLHDFCGSCTACLDACPTDAFTEPRVLDANRCLAYWNIESKEIPPPDIREAMDDWFFGCDICQTVCPWNIKWHKHNDEFSHPQGEPNEIENELRFILENSNKKLLQWVKETPLSRAGGRGLKRNALIVIGNKKLTNLKDIVATYTDNPRLGELAQWTLNRLS